MNKSLSFSKDWDYIITIKYNERNSLSIPDTSVLLEGNKVYIYGTNQIIIINMFVNKTVINKTLRYQEQLDFSSSVKSFIENEKY